MLNLFAYLAYLTVSVYITLVVGRTLNQNGLVFLTNQLAGNKPLAIAINNLLLIGYYLINSGYVLLVLNANSLNIDELNQLIYFLSLNIGLVSFMLGLMHMVIFYVITRWKPANIVTVIEEPQQ